MSWSLKYEEKKIFLENYSLLIASQVVIQKNRLCLSEWKKKSCSKRCTEISKMHSLATTYGDLN